MTAIVTGRKTTNGVLSQLPGAGDQEQLQHDPPRRLAEREPEQAEYDRSRQRGVCAGHRRQKARAAEADDPAFIHGTSSSAECRVRS